jgi:hypothetical protein
VAHELHQQGGGVPTRSRALGQRFLGRLHARLEADHVANVAREALIDADDEINGAAGVARQGRQVALIEGRGRRLDQVRRQFLPIIRVVLEWKILRFGREEEIERIEHRHLGDQINLDAQLAGRIRKYQSGEVVCLGVLLPIDEMAGRLHLE